jgi:hypothetical protein
MGERGKKKISVKSENTRCKSKHVSDTTISYNKD